MKRASAALLLALLASCDDRGSGLTGFTPGLPASQLVLTSQPTQTKVGVNISPALQVQVRNSAGQVVTGGNSVVTVAITTGTGTAGAILNGTLSQSTVNGVALFNNLNIDRTGTGSTLTFSSSQALAAAVTTAFDVIP